MPNLFSLMSLIGTFMFGISMVFSTPPAALIQILGVIGGVQ